MVQSRVAAARGIVRSLYALSRHVRLYGLTQSRTGPQLESTYTRICGLMPARGFTVTLLGDRLSVESSLLEAGPAEQSFARYLHDTSTEAFHFSDNFTLDQLEDIVSAMAFQAPVLRKGTAPLASPTTGDNREWLSDPSHLLLLVNLALEPFAFPESASEAPVRLSELPSEEIATLLHVMGKLGTSVNQAAAVAAARELQRLPDALLASFRQVLLNLAESHPAPAGDVMLLRVADQVVIRFILSKLENGKITASQIPSLLERLGRQLFTLRAMLPSHTGESASHAAHFEVLERQLWNTAPDEAKRAVLLLETPFYVPASCIVPFIERLIADSEESVAASILRNYGDAVDGRDAEGRRRSAMGIPDLAELYALVTPDYIPKLLRSVSRQLMREPDLHMQSFLSAALVRLSHEVQQQRDFVGTAAAADALDEIMHRRPVLGLELRPRISVENRLPEYLDEALTFKTVPPELVGLLQRHAIPVTQQLCNRFLGCSLREESARLTDIARHLGDDTREELLRRLRTGNSEEALGAVGLLAALAPDETTSLLPRRAADWSRAQQDLLIQQLSIAASSSRGGVLLNLLPHLDPLIIPGAIDEIGISGNLHATNALLEIALAGDASRFTAYGKVKAIEALGRLSAEKAVDGLNEILHSRKMLHWAQPHELRIAALQALFMIDHEIAAHVAPQSGISAAELSLGPLAIDPHNPWARQRRYQRVFPTKPMAAVATSRSGKAGLDIMALSLGGGKARRQGNVQAGFDITLQLQLVLRKLNSQILVRNVAASEITFEIADIGLADRSRLRHLLLAQTPAPQPPRAAA